MRRSLGRALPFLFGAALVLSSDLSAVGKAHRIAIEGMKFAPERIEVAVGDAITWTNRDLVPHNVISGGAVKSHVIHSDKQWTYVAREKGEIAYLCTLHPGMRGMLVVK